MNNKKIGVFDSGVGGLTVLSALKEIMPNEDYIYIGDLLNSPYGEKTPEQIENFSRTIINYLISKDVKAIVVGCNTASSYNLDKIKEELNFPIFSVLEAAKFGISKKDTNVLLAATRATVNSKVYDETLISENPWINLFKQACPLIASEVENANLTDKEIQNLVDSYIKEYSDKEIDLLILGCTHYPIWDKYFQNSIGTNTKLLDPATLVARMCFEHLNEKDMLSDQNSGEVDFLVTDKETSFEKNKNKIFPKLSTYNTKKIEIY